jgi:hypothetical protein
MLAGLRTRGDRAPRYRGLAIPFEKVRPLESRLS